MTLAAQNPTAYRPDLAGTLNNLGNVYDDTHRFAEAEAAFKEAAGIRRELAAQNPAAYRPDLATTLNNLASLHATKLRRRRALYLYTAAPRAWPSRIRAPSRGLSGLRTRGAAAGGGKKDS